MASLSVKDRAKMFGNLASPNDTGKDRINRNIGSVGNKVSSSPFRSASPKAKFSPSPFSSGSPNGSRSVTGVGSKNLSAVFSTQTEKKNNLEARNNIDWPDEDGIPAPGSMNKNFDSTENSMPPVSSIASKFSNNSSPFKVLNNQKVQGKLPNYSYGHTKLETRESAQNHFVGDQKVQQGNVFGAQNKEEISTLKEGNSNTTKVSTQLESTDSSNSNHGENKPDINANNRNKPTRAMRLMKAKMASPSPNVSKNLKQSLQAANVVMQEEKSDAGASDASSRSSLSNKELSNIAKRALKKSIDNTQISSSQEARRALLNVTASKEKKTIESGVASDRLGLKASRVLAIKNSAKARATRNAQSNMDIVKTLSTHSNDSSRSRRMEHPAFAGRQVKTNISSAHMLASFHQFKTQRQSFPSKPKHVDDSCAKNKARAENSKKHFDEDFEETFSDDDSLRSLEQEDTMHSAREMGGESMHSMSERQARSMHSTSGRMGKIQFTKTSCNDTVISSLSGNTQSLQSVPSKMMSPKAKNLQQTFRLDPTPEDPPSSRKYELGRLLSPGPSNRSGHSFANSIISASPRADYRSPSVRERPDTSFMDTLEEKPSSSQESAGNSAELLDAAVEAAIEDMEIIDSPRTNPSAGSEGNTLQILSSSSTGCSNSPPGFVFKDTEESDHIIPPDPEGEDFVNPAHNSVEGGLTTSISANEKLEKFEKVSKKASERRTPVEFEVAKNKNDVEYQKQGSTSTKQTVSTSIRSGMSSIQNGADIERTKSDPPFDVVDRETYEGSTSIRTGLSGIQSQRYSNDMENSISIHSTVPTEDKDADKAEQPGVTKYPDTIQEEKSVATKDESTNSFSGLKVKPTATTDRSSGLTTGGSTSSSDPSVNERTVSPGTNPVNMNGNSLPPIQTEGNEETSNNGFSLLSPGSRSSRAWKSGFGKSIGDAIKTVLAKASPRNSGHQSKTEENDDGGSLFEDDDDDIFGGLEVEQEIPVKPVTPKKQKLDDKTTRLNNFVSNDVKDPSVSRRTTTSLSRRTNESFSRRANGSISRRTNQSKSRKSIQSGSTRKMRTGGMANSSPANRMLPKTPSQRQKRTSLTPSAKSTAVRPYTNDKSGMILDGSDVVHNVNSDITSSLISGPVSGQSPFHKAMKEASKFIDLTPKLNEKQITEEIPEPDYSKEEMGGSFTKFMEESDASSVEGKALEPSANEKFGAQDDEETVDTKAMEDEQNEKRLGSMLLNFGCGLVDTCGGFANLCTPGDKANVNVGDETAAEAVDCDNKDSASVSSRSELTSLEKKVWKEWDRLNERALGPKKPNVVQEDEKKDNEKKRKEVQEKLLDIANTETQHSEQFEKSTLIENDEGTKTTASEGASLSASGSTESESETRFTKESESEGSGNSFGNSLTSGESLETLSQDSTRGTYSSASYSTGEESDGASYDPSRSGASRDKSKASSTSGPILLSFSQRSLMEKFSKQLTAVGIEVLKLNTRKQWQTRYFTVSKEQIALSAHEAISKTGELAQCPKALLWLKKFNPKSGGYGIVNIDKNGHGGMLLVDLVDVQVSERKDDMVDNPIPKKLLDGFDRSALITLKYKMKGILRSIEFVCRDNDEAQFLCTCMRVIRDLLRRERSLRQKLSKQRS